MFNNLILRGGLISQFLRPRWPVAARRSLAARRRIRSGSSKFKGTTQDQACVGNPQHVMLHVGLDLRETHRREPDLFLAVADELPTIFFQCPRRDPGLFGNETAVAGDEPSVRSQGEPRQFEQFRRAFVVQVVEHTDGEHEVKRSALLLDGREADVAAPETPALAEPLLRGFDLLRADVEPGVVGSRQGLKDVSRPTADVQDLLSGRGLGRFCQKPLVIIFTHQLLK